MERKNTYFKADYSNRPLGGVVMICLWLALLVPPMLLMPSGTAWAKSGYKTGYMARYPHIEDVSGGWDAKEDTWCSNMCHDRSSGSGCSTNASGGRNTFGTQIENVFVNDFGCSSSCTAELDQVQEYMDKSITSTDADSDGWNNIYEIYGWTYWGYNASDSPRCADVDAAKVPQSGGDMVEVTPTWVTSASTVNCGIGSSDVTVLSFKMLIPTQTDDGITSPGLASVMVYADSVTASAAIYGGSNADYNNARLVIDVNEDGSYDGGDTIITSMRPIVWDTTVSTSTSNQPIPAGGTTTPRFWWFDPGGNIFAASAIKVKTAAADATGTQFLVIADIPAGTADAEKKIVLKIGRNDSARIFGVIFYGKPPYYPGGTNSGLAPQDMATPFSIKGATYVVGGTGGGCSPTPALVAKKGPGDDTSNQPVSGLTLDWQTAADADYYDVIFSSSYAGVNGGTAILETDYVPSSRVVNGLQEATTYWWRIDSKNASCGTTTDTDIWSFTTECSVPGMATKSSPGNDTGGVTTSNPSLSWGVVGDADSYDVIFSSTKAGVIGGSALLGNTASTTYGAGTLAEGTTYWWRIDSRKACGSTESDTAIWSFTTECSAPTMATKDTPNDLATGVTTSNPILSWGVVGDADSYDVIFSSTKAGVTGGSALLGNTASTTYGAGTLAETTTYWWRIDSRKACGTTEPDTAIWSFTTACNSPGMATKSSPGNDTGGVSVSNPTLSWGVVGDADSYDVIFSSTKAGVTGGSALLGNTASTTYGAGTLAETTTYWWRIDSRKACGTTEPDTAIWSFTTECSAPGMATKSSPGNDTGGVTTSNPTLSWGVVGDADSYDVIFSSTKAGVTGGSALLGNTASTTYGAGTLQDATTYWWRIDSRKACGTTEPDTAIWSFTTECSAPGMATKSSPGNDTGGVATSNPTLSWGVVGDADSYDVIFSSTKAGVTGGSALLGNTASTTYGAGTLAETTTYWWRIDSRKACGTTEPDTAIWSFTTECSAPGMATKVNPGDDTGGVATSNPTLSWGVVSDADSYDVIFSSTKAGVTGGTALLGNTASTTYGAGTLAETTTYWWRIDSRKACGTTEPDTNIWSFTTTCNSPGMATKSSPGDDTGGVATSNPSLSWGVVGDADSYDVIFSSVKAGVIGGTALLGNTASTTYGAGTLQDATTYWWRIDSRKACGSTEPDTAIWSFTTLCSAPGMATKDIPNNLATGVTVSNPILSWGVVGDADSYDVIFSSTKAGVIGGTALLGNTASTTYGAGTLQDATTYWWRIDSRKACGTTEPDTAIWSFTTECSAPGMATKSSPGNDTGGVTTSNPTLSWGVVGDADSYDVIFSSVKAGVTGGSALLGNTASTTYGAGTLAETTTYWWRIDSRKACGSTEPDTAIWSFTTTCNSPGMATKVNPGDDTGGVAVSNPTLSWGVVGDADSYDVIFSSTKAGVTGGSALLGNTAGTTYGAGTLQDATTYWWRIDSRKACGTTEPDTAIWSFTTECPAPTMATKDTPNDLATGVTTSNPILSWGVVGDADSYDVIFSSTKAGVTGGSALLGNTAGTTYGAGALQDATTYWWRIDSRKACGTTEPDTAIWSFTTECSAPGMATKSSPGNDTGGVATSNPTLSWGVVGDADSYDVIFSSTKAGVTGGSALLGNTASTTYGAGTLAETTTYWWRIDSRKACGSTEPDTNIWSFTTTCNSPGMATKVNPGDDTGGVATSNPTLSWGVVGDADTYDVIFSSVKAGVTGGTALLGNTASTTYGAGTLAEGTTYWWRIDSRKACGSTEPDTAIWSFRTVCPAPGMATKVNPGDDTGGVSVSNPTLSWGVVGDADSYDVIFSSTKAGVTGGTALLGNTASTTYGAGTLAENTTYWWRIDSRKACGTTEPDTAIWSFTTCAGVPGAPTVPSPGDGNSGIGVDDNLTWTAAAGADSYNVYFGISFPPTYNSTISSTNFEPGTMSGNTPYFWKIIANNTCGSGPSGGDWDFTTELLNSVVKARDVTQVPAKNVYRGDTNTTLMLFQMQSSPGNSVVTSVYVVFEGVVAYSDYVIPNTVTLYRDEDKNGVVNTGDVNLGAFNCSGLSCSLEAITENVPVTSTNYLVAGTITDTPIFSSFTVALDDPGAIGVTSPDTYDADPDEVRSGLITVDFDRKMRKGWNMVSVSQVFSSSTFTGDNVFSDDTTPFTPYMIKWDNDGSDASWNCGSPNCRWTVDMSDQQLTSVHGYFFYAETDGQILDVEGGKYANELGSSIVSSTITPGGNIVGNPFDKVLSLNPGGTPGIYVYNVTDAQEETYYQAVQLNWVEADIYWFNGATYEAVNWSDSYNYMVPWRGYWVRLKKLDGKTYQIRFKY